VSAKERTKVPPPFSPLFDFGFKMDARAAITFWKKINLGTRSYAHLSVNKDIFRFKACLTKAPDLLQTSVNVTSNVVNRFLTTTAKTT
jgi:hypothetical protein